MRNIGDGGHARYLSPFQFASGCFPPALLLEFEPAVGDDPAPLELAFEIARRRQRRDTGEKLKDERARIIHPTRPAVAEERGESFYPESRRVDNQKSRQSARERKPCAHRAVFVARNIIIDQRSPDDIDRSEEHTS